jgi:ubiquinone/menaquinone biosynthesis C-methylase UbiE
MRGNDDTVFRFYNTIDGDTDEKAYDSDILVQRYFQRRKTCEIKELVIVNHGDLVLDIGCGSGVQVRSLMNGNRAIGMDVSLNAIKFARTKDFPNTDFILADAQYLPIKAGAVDKVVCAEIIEHLSCPQNLITEIHRVLKDKGIAVITTPNNNLVWKIYQYFWDHFGRGRNYGETHISLFRVETLQAAFVKFTGCRTKTIFFLAPVMALSGSRFLLKAGMRIDRVFERRGWGVSIIHYAEKRNV